jgi:hypothetical protein
MCPFKKHIIIIGEARVGVCVCVFFFPPPSIFGYLKFGDFSQKLAELVKYTLGKKLKNFTNFLPKKEKKRKFQKERTLGHI